MYQILSKLFSLLPSLLLLFFVGLASASYSNVTLVSEDGDLEVVVYLPVGLKPTESTYYVSSRFEHGSMIGSMKRKSRRVVGDKVVEEIHNLFGDKNWRIPHNSQWPESGIGLASEFGVGDDGAFCQYRCGWNGVNDVTNGVLGYREARVGEPFLKIGVGALIKGSCPSCDSTDNYRFNSPYEFAELPQWRILHSDNSVLSMEHEAMVKDQGYRLHKDIVVDNNALIVTSILTNLGSETFQTSWYSHNFFTCDGTPVSEGYSLDLDIHGQRGALYEEPGVIGSWAEPLQSFARITQYKDHVTVDVSRTLAGDTRIKAEFVQDIDSTGAFTMHGCKTLIRSELPDVESGKLEMYAYNLYLEKGTFSPEPQIMINLKTGESASWTQRLVIEDEQDARSKEQSLVRLRTMALTNVSSVNAWKLLPAFISVLLLVASLAIVGQIFRSSRRRPTYRSIPDIDFCNY